MNDVIRAPNLQQTPYTPTGLTNRREGVTFEDVKQVAEKLTQKGIRVTLRAVRAELGKGSLSTLQKHLSALRLMEEPIPLEGPPPLSPQALRALASEVERATAERTSKIDTELQDAQSAVELLVQENESLRSSVLEYSEKMGNIRQELAESTGTADALRAQVTALNEQLSSALSSAESARQACVLAQEQKQAAERHSANVESELRTSKILVEQELAEAKKEALTAAQRMAALEAQAGTRQLVEEQLRTMTERFHDLQQRLEDATLRLAVVEVERSVQNERVAELRIALARAEENTQRLMERFFSYGFSSEVGDEAKKSSKNQAPRA